MRVGVLASGSGTILRALLGRGSADRRGRRRPAVRRARDRRAAGVARRARRARPTSAPTSTASRTRTTSSTRSQRHDVDLVAMAGFGTILVEAVRRRVRRPGREHPPRAAARVQGLARGARRARRGREGDRAAPCTSSPRTSTSGPILAQEAVPVLDGDTEETLHERIKEVERRLYPDVIERLVKADSMSDEHEDQAGAAVRVRQDRARRARQGPARARRRARVVGQHVDGARRRRHPGHRGRRGHRLARDARRPGEDAAPEDPRRPARRPRQRDAPRRSRPARHRAVRPRRVEPLPVRRAARHRDHRHRRSGDDARRGEEPRVGHDRHESRRSTRRCSTSCARTTAPSAPRRAARSRSRRSRAPPRTTPRSCSGCRPTSCCPQHLVLALDRTDETLRYGENPHQHGGALPPRAARRAGGTASRSTAGSRSRTSTTTTPTRRGSIVHDLGDRPGVRDHQAREPVRRRASTTTSRPRTSARSSATSAPRSAASSR